MLGVAWRPALRIRRCGTRSWAGGGEEVVQEAEGGEFAGAAGLFHQRCQSAKLLHDLLMRQQMHTGGQDGGFENGVAGAIEAEEFPTSPTRQHFRFQHGPFLTVIETDDAKLVIPAGILEHVAENV